MKLHRILLIAVLASCVATAGCASSGGVRHGWIMRGQVLALDDGVATVCVGSSDGAKVGQVLVVRHITTTPATRGSVLVKSRDVGQVRIAELFQDHYARASVVSGAPAVNDVVELEMK